MIDVIHEINAERRIVGTRALEAGEARTVTIIRTYNAEVDDVWDACTNPERIRRWFSGLSGDLKLGGRYQVEGNASGTIQSCDPPRSFTATWEFGGDISWIELRLSAEERGRTRFELEHIAHVGDDRWAQFGPGALGVGWDLAILGLGLYLDSGEARDPQEAMAWSTSEEGRRFIGEASDAWRDASITSGTPPEAAQGAAQRTTAFYTGT